MKSLIKKNFILLLLFATFSLQSDVFAKADEQRYTKDNISNYFLGLVAAKENNAEKAYSHLKKVEKLKNKHTDFNTDFIRTLVLVENFEEAFAFSKRVWKKNIFFFEADLLLGINFFINKDYNNAEKHFLRLNKISRYNLIFDEFVGNALIAWSKAEQGKEEASFNSLSKIPKSYKNLKNIQNSFLKCFFDSKDTQRSFENLIKNKNYNFSRYNFFLTNYYLFKNEIKKAKDLIRKSRTKHSSNLLIKQTDYLLSKNKFKKVKSFYNCKNPKDSIAEFFYIIANIYSNEKEYELSNFYLKISYYLNKDFLANQTLLAENFYYQKKYEYSKKIYKTIKSLGQVYSWHATKKIATILIDEKGKDYAAKLLQKEFNSLPNPDFENYYQLANFYKNNKYFEESIKHYSSALKILNKDHILIPKVLERRGTSYERIGDWKNAEKDLSKSLEILPDQAHVLNYLAYTWIDKGINLEEGLKMLKKANSLRGDDGYITDSLGWAYYVKKNYIEAEIYLQKAVELLPYDPIINDHYADTLWMLNKNIQARYIWGNILKIEDAEEELKNSINNKLIFGIKKNYN